MNFSTISFDPSIDGAKLMFQAYCLNPPPDSCAYGPCPNADVTGVGQQVSVYITSVTFIISVVYIPDLVRPMIYAHLGLIYSLLISALISVCLSQLTQNDGVFVLVTVASPGSFFLWTSTLLSLLPFPTPFPFPLKTTRKTGGRSKEVVALRALVLLSLAFEIAMICVVFVPSDFLVFSQPACNRDYGNKLWIELLWELPYIVHGLWTVILFVVCGHQLKVWEDRRRVLPQDPLHPPEPIRERAEWISATQTDVVTWTEVSLAHAYDMHPDSGTIRFIISILQLYAFPSIGFVINLDIFVVTVLCIFTMHDLVRDRALLRRQIRVIMKRLTPMLFTAITFTMGATIGRVLPATVDAVVACVCITIVWHKLYPPEWEKTFLLGIFRRRFMYLAGLAIALSLSSVAWDLTPDGLETLISQAPSALLSLGTQPLLLNMYSLPLWILAWLATSVWPDRRRPSVLRVWQAISQRAHLLKAAMLVLAPNALWIQSSIATNPTTSTTMTFGQIFALIVSVVTVVSLLDALREVERETWRAFFLSKPLPGKEADPATPIPLQQIVSPVAGHSSHSPSATALVAPISSQSPTFPEP